MRHLVLGNGNLGNSLANELLKKYPDVMILTASNGWRYPDRGLTAIYDFYPDHIWVTCGAGSVEQAKVSYIPFTDLHIRLPIELTQKTNTRTSLHFFSTDYVLDNEPQQSLYALSKQHMEAAIKIIKRPKTYVYRVGSLYGTYKPNQCFPYKLKKNSLKNTIKLPDNRVIPTPTDWLAKVLINNLEHLPYETKNYHVAPQSDCSVRVWGEKILGVPIESNDLDLSRPLLTTRPTITTQETWLDLWNEREPEWQKILGVIR